MRPTWRRWLVISVAQFLLAFCYKVGRPGLGLRLARPFVLMFNRDPLVPRE